MPSFKVLRDPSGESIVMDFVPEKFPLEITNVVSQFRDEQEKTSSDFRMDDTIKQQTGVQEIEKQELQEKIEERALEKLKDLQEGAYQEGYALGKEEGRNEAYEENQAAIKERLDQLDAMLDSIGQLKMDLLSFNEAHMVKMLTVMASKVAMQEIEINKDAIVQVIKKTLELSQAEENVTVRVSERELDHIEHFRSEQLRESDPLKKVHIEGDAEIQPGGCIIETNYGVVDASLSARIEKLWELMDGSMPAVKDKIEESGESSD